MLNTILNKFSCFIPKPCLVALTVLAMCPPSHSVASGDDRAPEKISERVARGSPKDREYLHSAILSLKSWAATEADLKLAASLRDSFRKWAPDGYLDLTRWIEVEQLFGPLKNPELAEIIGHLARLNQAAGICRVPTELSEISEFDANDAEKFEKEILIPCESLPLDDTTAALAAVTHPERVSKRPKESAAYLDRVMKGRKPSASLCQMTRVTNVIIGRWGPYDSCAKMLPAGADRADFICGAALELLDAGKPELAIKAIERPWVGKKEKPLLEGTRLRALLDQKKNTAAKAGLEKILKSEPLDSPDLLWAAEIAPDSLIQNLTARLDKVLKNPDSDGDALAEASALLEAVLTSRCPQATDPLAKAPDCKLPGSPAVWRQTLLERLTSGSASGSTRRTVERILLLLPAQAWKGTAPHVCSGAGLKDAPLPVLKSLSTVCRRIATATEAHVIQERLKTAGHAERVALLEGFAAGGTDHALTAALKSEFVRIAADEKSPLSERRLALIALAQNDCKGAVKSFTALSANVSVLLAEPAVRGFGCAGATDPLAALVTDSKADGWVRFAALDELSRLDSARAKSLATQLPASFAVDAARVAEGKSETITLRARYLDFAASGVIYPAVRETGGREVFIVENLKAEAVLRVDIEQDLGPEHAIGLENVRDDGEPSGDPLVLKLYRQPLTGSGASYVSEKYPSEFNDDGSLKRQAGGGGWTEF